MTRKKVALPEPPVDAACAARASMFARLEAGCRAAAAPAAPYTLAASLSPGEVLSLVRALEKLEAIIVSWST